MLGGVVDAVHRGSEGSEGSAVVQQRRTAGASSEEPAAAITTTQSGDASSSSENSGVAELKEDGQVFCDTAPTCA